MANIHDCLARAMQAGALAAPQGRAAQRQYAQLVERYREIMPLHQAQASAAADLKEATRRAARSRYHAVINQLQAARRLKHLIGTADDPAVAIRNLVERSANSDMKGENVRFLTESYTSHVNWLMRDVLQRHGLNVAGSVRKRASFERMILEAHGQNTGDKVAKDLAAALDEAQEFLRQEFNAHGGNIGKLKNRGLPHAHDENQLRRAGFETWREDIEAMLDWTQIENMATGRPFATQAGHVPARAETEQFLRDVFEGITTRGWDERDPKFATHGQALYNQRAEHRVLHFKPESWLAYNRRYGTGDPFSAMIGGLHGLAKDVAMMRVLGPNPQMGLEYAIQVAQKRTATLAAGGGRRAARMENAVDVAGKRTRAMLDLFSGASNVPEDAAWATFLSGTRATLTATQLGSATLSAVTDQVTIAAAAKVAGMGATDPVRQTVALMASKSTRESASRMGFIMDSLADAGGNYSRFMGQTMATGIPQRLSGITMRASGLTMLTDMERVGFKMAYAGFLAENAHLGFRDINPGLRRTFEARGITPADWDALRDPAGMHRDGSGNTWIAPGYWLEHQTALPRREAIGLSTRLNMAMLEIQEMAIPSASLEGRARVLMGTAPGSIGGEILRSTLMYKSFALSLMMNQYRQFLALPTPMSKVQYAAGMSALLILFGAVAVQLKELAKGRDPRPMDEKKFWAAALFQGGGLGIFGDFFAAETSRAGGGLAETVAGPVAGFASAVINPIASNASRAFAGQDTLLGRDAANFVRYNTPVLSSLWYERLAYDRLVADTLQRFLDPEAETLWRQQERRRERDYGTATFWERGTVLPDRAPDLSNIAGGAP